LTRLTPGSVRGTIPVASILSRSQATCSSVLVESTCPCDARIHRPVGAVRVFPDELVVRSPLGAASLGATPSAAVICAGTRASPYKQSEAKVSAQLGLAVTAVSEIIEEVSDVLPWLSLGGVPLSLNSGEGQPLLQRPNMVR